MHVTDEQAAIIADALMKPIKDGYAESQFGVYNGDQGVVGITRKFKKCYIFVEFNGKKDNSVRLPKMSTPLQRDEVIEIVIEALDIADTLQGRELDTEKPNFNPTKIGNFIKKRPDYKEPEKRTYRPIEEEEKEEPSPAKEEKAEENPIRYSKPDDNVEFSGNDVMEEESFKETEETVKPEENPGTELADEKDVREEESEPEKEEQSLIDALEAKDNSKEEPHDMSNEVDLRTLENEEGEPNAFYALGTVDGSKEQALTEIDPKKESPLFRQIAKHQEASAEEMQKVFATLVENAPRAAEMLYMATMVTALKVADGAAEEIAENLGIDEKDLIMANYEYELRKTKQ